MLYVCAHSTRQNIRKLFHVPLSIHLQLNVFDKSPQKSLFLDEPDVLAVTCQQRQLQIIIRQRIQRTHLGLS